MNNEERVYGKAIEIDDNATKTFFQNRTKKELPHRYNLVNYSDNDPQIVIDRDIREKDKVYKYLEIDGTSRVLDIGCGVGRWADKIAAQLTDGGVYCGVDYCKNFIDIAKENFADDVNAGRCEFMVDEFKNVNRLGKTFTNILINGVLMYINDSDIEDDLGKTIPILETGGVIYLKESVGRDKRFTLNHFYSEELSAEYSAIYRSIDEYETLIDKLYLSDGKFELVTKDFAWDEDKFKRKETTCFYWILRKVK